MLSSIDWPPSQNGVSDIKGTSANDYTRFICSLFQINFVYSAGGHLREFTDGESNFAALLQRAMDLEGVDRETLHHLVTLLLKVWKFLDDDKSEELLAFC